MQVRAEKIFPVLIPRLIATPITAFNARALELLVPVAGSALGKRITSIVDALYAALKIEKDEATIAQLELAFDAVLASVLDHDSGLSGVNMHALAMSKAESPEKRITGCAIFARFCRVAKCDFSDFTIDWIRQLVSLFDDRDAGVVGAAWLSLDALVKTIDKEDMEALVVPLRRTIEGVGTVGIHVDGFSRPNGLKPILRESLVLDTFLVTDSLLLSYPPSRSSRRYRRAARTGCVRHWRLGRANGSPGIQELLHPDRWTSQCVPSSLHSSIY
jgi:hypothetical protein